MSIPIRIDWYFIKLVLETLSVVQHGVNGSLCQVPSVSTSSNQFVRSYSLLAAVVVDL